MELLGVGYPESAAAAPAIAERGPDVPNPDAVSTFCRCGGQFDSIMRRWT
jgi:hypothetical protein